MVIFFGGFEETHFIGTLLSAPVLGSGQSFRPHCGPQVKKVCKNLRSFVGVILSGSQAGSVLLQREVSVDGGKGLTLWRPVGKEFNDPSDTTVPLQLVLQTQTHARTTTEDVPTRHTHTAAD